MNQKIIEKMAHHLYSERIEKGLNGNAEKDYELAEMEYNQFCYFLEKYKRMGLLNENSCGR